MKVKPVFFPLCNNEQTDSLSHCREMMHNDYHVIACYFKGSNHNLAKVWQEKQAALGLESMKSLYK